MWSRAWNDSGRIISRLGNMIYPCLRKIFSKPWARHSLPQGIYHSPWTRHTLPQEDSPHALEKTLIDSWMIHPSLGQDTPCLRKIHHSPWTKQSLLQKKSSHNLDKSSHHQMVGVPMDVQSQPYRSAGTFRWSFCRPSTVLASRSKAVITLMEVRTLRWVAQPKTSTHSPVLQCFS